MRQVLHGLDAQGGRWLGRGTPEVGQKLIHSKPWKNPPFGRFCTDWMRKEEVGSAEGFLKSVYDADRVAGVDLDFSLGAFASSPLYVPAHVFRSRHFGAKMRTFVSGAPRSRVPHASQVLLSHLRKQETRECASPAWRTGVPSPGAQGMAGPRGELGMMRAIRFRGRALR